MKNKMRVHLSVDSYLATQGCGFVKLNVNKTNLSFLGSAPVISVDEADYVLSFTSKESVDSFIEKLKSLRNRM
jgi:hypothetical protein